MASKILSRRLTGLAVAMTACLSSPIFAPTIASADDLTVARLHAQPGLTGPSVRAARFSPDGSMITILRGREDNARQLDLWSYDIETGEASMLVSSTDLVGEVELSEEEKNRRERQRIYDAGIISYAWDRQGEKIMFPLGGDIFIYDLASKTPTQITQTDSFETDPKFSPNGRYISFVRDDELYVHDIQTSTEHVLTSGADGTVRNAVSEFVAQEELDRNTGYWWSPMSDRLVFTQIDETPVPIAERTDINADGVVTIRQRYPFAGANNVAIKLGIVAPTKDAPIWIDLGDNPDIYVADVYWGTGGKTIYVARLTRDQKRLDLLSVDPKTGDSSIVLSETSDVWVNLGLGLRRLKDGGFLWSSERSGYQHIYRYDADGNVLGSITGDKGIVTDIDCVDQENEVIYYTGWDDSALERHVFAKPFAGPAKRLTSVEGWHGASFSSGCKRYIQTSSTDTQPRQTSVHSNDGAFKFWLSENDVSDKSHPYHQFLASHQAWEYGQLKADDGQMLDYKILKPKGLKRRQKAPAIIFVYGGPHAQRVRKGFGNLFEQMLVDKGYVVMRLDNRGAGNRGTAFEFPLYKNMGGPETRDQALGARWLGEQSFVDKDRIGVYGWSYGGYMTLHMLLQNPELYAGGVSGAPVTDWKLYDTAYTERYMGDPERDADAYEKSAPLTHVENLEDPLLIIHGMADDNVVFQNTVKLIDALQKGGKTFDLMTYPGEKHGFRKRTSRAHRDQLIVDFFDRTLAEKD